MPSGDDPSDRPPADFYTGLVAELYEPLRSSVPEAAPYEQFIAMSGEPALELGCGAGDPMLDLRAAGLDVEGLDSSVDMLERCRRAAADRGIDVVLHHASIETMELGRRYRSIYLAGPTFNLIVHDAVTSAALARIREHLEPDGHALVPLFIPTPTPPAQWDRPKAVTREDGAILRVTTVGEQRHEAERLQITTLRYEIERDGSVEHEDRDWTLHWHTQEGFQRLATDAGFDVRAVLSPTGGRAGRDDDVFVFLLSA